jgi:hypothetical protein
MQFLASIADDWRNWVVLALALAVFVWNGRNRIAWDEACEELASKNPNAEIPERRWRSPYDAFDLRDFVSAIAGVRVRGYPAREFYVDHILRRSDLCFAIALSALTAVFWAEVAVSPLLPIWLTWAALPFGAMAIVYGVADVAEDVKLAKILSHPRIDRADAAAASALTRIKFVSLPLSIVGGAIFVIISAIEEIAKKLRRMKKVREPARM